MTCTSFEEPVIRGDGFRFSYPADRWAAPARRFRDAEELVREADDGTARVMVTVERRRSHQEAVERLAEIDAEQDEASRFMAIAGWPALVREYCAPVDVPGDPGLEGDEERLATRLTVAVAAGARIVRLEGFVPPGDDGELAREILAIGESAVMEEPADGDVEAELQQLRARPRLVLPRPLKLRREEPRQADGPGQPAPSLPGPPPVVHSSEGEGVGLVQRIQTVGTDSEIEIAVSNDGQTVIVVNNARNFATSNDGGQTFTASGNAPAPPGGNANGDPSIAFGATGNFYFAYIGFPATGQCSTSVTRSTDNGQSFAFVANATLCDDTGMAAASCFPDQEHIAADRVNLSSTMQDQVYSTWRNFSGGGCGGPAGTPTAIMGPEIPTLVCSSDSGANWGAAVAVGNMGDAFPRITVGSDGFVYVVYRAGNNIMLNKFSSCDNGLTQQMGFPVTIAAGIMRVTCPIPGIDRCNNGSDLSSHTVAVDDTNANHVYASYAINTSAGVNENVILRDSIDGGQTWPAARVVQLNTAVNGRRFMPWVCSTNGIAYVTWYGMRNATAAQNDLADFFGGSGFLDGMGNLQAGAELQVSTVSDPLCASGWPQPPRAANDSESCAVQPQLAGMCTDAMGNATGIRCDFSDCGGAGMGVGASCQCNVAANQTCNLGGGVPKYGDYNGNACGNGQLFAAWASATSPAGISPASTNIDVFFETPLNDPPIADAGPDQTLECVLGGVQTMLDGTGSSDPDGDPLTFTWTDDFLEGGGTVFGPQPVVTFLTVSTNVVTLTVEDPVGFEDTDTVVITVVDTTAPSIAAPPDVQVECTGPAGTPVILGTPAVGDTCDPSVEVSNDAPALFPLGQTIVTWTAVDDSGNIAQDTQIVTVVDTTPPDLDVSLTPSVLWPPNHTLRDITATIVVSDICDPNPAVRLSSAVSNEPDDGIGDGNTVGDIQGVAIGTDDRSFQLRAERAGGGSGRVYTITYEAEDQSGNTTSEADTVLVPRNMGP